MEKRLWEFVYYTNATTINLSIPGTLAEPLFGLCQYADKPEWFISAKELYLLFTAYVNELPLPSTIKMFRDMDLIESMVFAVHTEDMLLVLNGGNIRKLISFRIWDNAAAKAILIYKEMYGDI